MTPEPVAHRRSKRSAANKASAKLAAVAACEISPEPPSGPADELLREALTTNTTLDLDNWKAWVEIESEPAFFSGLLRDLGVQDVKVAEMFGVSMEDVQLLPQPVLGFVFLCRYATEDPEELETLRPPNDPWFANQTMANGCATVALLNILMNKPTVQLGTDLTAFKSETASLPPLLRGFLLEGNQALRRVHNSYARCMEHLNADLLLANEFDESGGWPDKDPPATNNTTKSTSPRQSSTSNHKKKRKSSTATANSPPSKKAAPRRPRRRRRRAVEDACHYKAFVHVADHVWVLDGLEAKPVSLGPANADSWVRVAVEDIAHRIAVAGDMVNVLAVCESPQLGLRRELCTNIKTLSTVYASIPASSRPELDPNRLYIKPPSISSSIDAVPASKTKSQSCQHEAIDSLDPTLMADFKITPTQIHQTQLDGTTLEKTPDTLQEQIDLVQSLQTQQARIASDYLQVDHEIGLEQELCSGRKRDYGSVVHVWARKLAERGELQSLIG
ncbi:hypothetical protein BD289DRAFT_481091 [Coniella lustricola]|uniref:Ubiquitin carboxyl-terminal hydrolase n=1 Tax=Coniella lustricola TaxID=2025994 RepID=A0A2T3ADF0_9PEZI|nr:hypothetical protein BD289DRAFT_481091 [Coniella lustricola]